ncbi:MAG: hypothetical protein WCC14_11980 [Acidobacteriaceae bacterium]
MRKRIVVSLLTFVAGAATLSAQLQPTYLKIRVEKADRIIEPATPSSSNCYDGKDNVFTEIEASTGVFYGYTANGYKNSNGATSDYSTCMIQGNQVYNMGATPTGVIASGSPNSPSSAFSSCGYWLNGVYKSGSTYYGFAHAEAYGNSTYGKVCDYPPTTKSMGLLTSTDGVNWTPQGQIIANPSAGDSSGSEYGEGDCTPVPFNGYLYLYCRRTQDTQTSIARAPLTSNFSQSNWKKLTAPGAWNGAWNANDYAVGLYGSSSSIFGNYGNIMLLRVELGGTGTAHGMQMSFSGATDPTTFTRISDPIIYEDAYVFPYANTSSDLIAYPSALSGTDGSRTWNGYFILTYDWVPNQSDAESAPDHGRTIVMRNVSVSQESSPQSPQVGVAISRWDSSSIGQRISTVEAVPYGFVSPGYVLDTNDTSYLMTTPPSSGSMTVVECVSTASWPSAAHPDHLMTAYATGSDPSNSGCDDNYAFLRTSGYLYSSSQGSSTVPVYRCKPNSPSTGSTTHFVSNDASCEGYGTEERLLGYALAN